MVLVLLLIILEFQASWQYEVTEKNLDQILDQLIEETVIDTFSNESLNNSRIIYLKPEDILSRRTQDSSLKTTIHSSEYEDLEDLVHQIGQNNKAPDRLREKGNSVIKQITVEIEQSEVLKDGDSIEELQIISNGFSKTGRPLFEEIVDSSVENYTTKHESNVIHKNPEVIDDKITSDDIDNNINPNSRREDTVNSHNTVQINHTNIDNLKKVQNEVAAKALGSLLKLLFKVPQTKSLEVPHVYTEQDDISAILSAARMHDAYDNQIMDNLPLAYRSLLTHDKPLRENLPERYRTLFPMINSPRSAYLRPDLQFNRWRSNVRPNQLLSIPRPHQLNHVNFFRNPFNIVPRFVYRPPYQHHRYHHNQY